MKSTKNQVLLDVTSTGRQIDWGARKMANEYLAMAYDDIDKHIADRLRGCATRLVYGIGEDGRRRLRAANFCRVRLCPICQWRRSLKLYGQMRQAMEYIARKDPRSYIFVTLTVRNCSLDKLSLTLDKITDGLHNLVHYKEFLQAVDGWYRGTEVTHNLDQSSPDYDTYHPHIHMVMAVKPSYFKSRYYISQKRWGELWQRAIGADYIPICDVRKVKGDTAKAVAEATKYAAKAKDYIILDDLDLTIETVRGLDAALRNRRLVGFGGCLLSARRALQQVDPDKADLVQVGDNADSVKDVYHESYAWHSGYTQYIREID